MKSYQFEFVNVGILCLLHLWAIKHFFKCDWNCTPREGIHSQLIFCAFFFLTLWFNTPDIKSDARVVPLYRQVWKASVNNFYIATGWTNQMLDYVTMSNGGWCWCSWTGTALNTVLANKIKKSVFLTGWICQDWLCVCSLSGCSSNIIIQ